MLVYVSQSFFLLAYNTFMSTKGSLYFELDFIYFPSRLSLIILIKTWEKINYLTYMGSGLEVQIVKFKYSTLCTYRVLLKEGIFEFSVYFHKQKRGKTKREREREN